MELIILVIYFLWVDGKYNFFLGYFRIVILVLFNFFIILLISNVFILFS